MLDNGGLPWAATRSATSAGILYGWAEECDWATPFVADPSMRSNVVGTIDLDDSIDADAVCAALRANGILDTDAYRKLGRNQLRIGMFPAIDPSDIEALTASITHVVTNLA
jgi:phosphoserine aminotransferase